MCKDEVNLHFRSTRFRSVSQSTLCWDWRCIIRNHYNTLVGRCLLIVSWIISSDVESVLFNSSCHDKHDWIKLFCSCCVRAPFLLKFRNNLQFLGIQRERFSSCKQHLQLTPTPSSSCHICRELENPLCALSFEYGRAQRFEQIYRSDWFV